MRNRTHHEHREGHQRGEEAQAVADAIGKFLPAGLRAMSVCRCFDHRVSVRGRPASRGAARRKPATLLGLSGKPADRASQTGGPTRRVRIRAWSVRHIPSRLCGQTATPDRAADHDAGAYEHEILDDVLPFKGRGDWIDTEA